MAASALSKGDVVVCEAGDLIPSDGEIIEGIASVDESTITGESARVIRESGGWAEDVSDAEIAEAMVLLAKTEGVFAETAGGVTVAVARKLIEQGKIGRDDETVLCITGNGLKTQDAIAEVVESPALIAPTLKEFTRLLDGVPAPALV